MNPLLRTTALAALWTLVLCPPSRAEDMAPATKALASVYVTDVMATHIAEWCTAKAPGQAPAVKAAWRGWQQRFHIPDVQRRVEAQTTAAWRQSLQENGQQLVAKLAAQGTPDTVCAAMPAQWNGPDFDMRRQHAAAYDPSGRVTGTPGGTASTAPQPPPTSQAAPTTTATTGTVFTPPQLHQHFAEGSLDERRRRLNTPLFIRGVVAKVGSASSGFLYHLHHNDPVHASRLPIATGLHLEPYVGREVVITGTLDELPGSMAFLRNARLVTNTAGLTPSTLDKQYGVYRKGVAVDQIRAAPGRGVPNGDIAAVVFNTVPMLRRTDVSLLLKDGTLYDRKGVPPSDLDVAASRRLEPQHWHQWKADGKDGFLVRRSDRDGKPTGDWKRLEGIRVTAWPAGQRLNGSYTDEQFHGSLGTGGTHFKENFLFKPDGRFEFAGYSQSSAGALAAMNGFSSSVTHHRDGKGSQTSVGVQSGTGAAGTEAPTATIADTRKSDDGSGNRGTYRVDGYTLELRYDNGVVSRLLAFPWSKDWAFIGSTSYQAREAKR